MPMHYMPYGQVDGNVPTVGTVGIVKIQNIQNGSIALTVEQR